MRQFAKTPTAQFNARGRGALALVAAVLGTLVSGCDALALGRPDPANRPHAETASLDFQMLYAQNCAGCHGAEGSMGPAPPLADGLFLAIASDEQLHEVIHHGRAGTPMPAFTRDAGGALDEPQMAALIAGIRRHWSKPASDLPKDIPPYASASAGGHPSSEAIERGQALFARACAGCHESGGKDHGAHHDDRHEAHHGAHHHAHHDADHGPLDDRDFLTLISDQALRRIIITGRPDLGMPNFAQSEGRGDDFQPLSSEQIDDLVALLAHWRSSGSDLASPEEP